LAQRLALHATHLRLEMQRGALYILRNHLRMEEAVRNLPKLLLVVFAFIGALTVAAALMIGLILVIFRPGYRPPPPAPERVVRIIVAGSRVGAVTVQGYGNSIWEAYETRSDGAEWFHLWRLEGEPLAALQRTPVQTTTAHPRNPLTVYRIAQNCGGIEASSDGGESWRAVWSVTRANTECPYELAFTPDGEMLLVALGEDGIARMDSRGVWTQHTVGDAAP
jgi:hypothetical protein